MNPERAADRDEAYEFRVDDFVFHVRVDDGRPRAVEGPYTDTPAAVARADAQTFVEIGSGCLTPFEAVASSRLLLQGDTEAILRCSTLLGLVPPQELAQR
jgi:hypothetical protein